VAENIGELISCVVLPLEYTGGVLLPASALVEVLDTTNINVVVDLQEGIIGKMQWKSAAIPLVSYEAAAGLALPVFNRETRAVIVRVPSEESSHIKYMAFAIHGLPKFIEVSALSLKTSDVAEELTNHLAETRVQVDGMQLWVPNMDAIVQHLHNNAV